MLRRLLVVLGLMAAAGIQAFWTVGGVAVAGILSGLCGFFGLKTATNASARTTAAAKEAHKHDEWTFYTAGDRRSTHVLKPAAIESRGRLGSSFINIVENLAQSEYVQNQYASMYGLQPRAAIAKYRAQLLQEISSTVSRLSTLARTACCSRDNHGRERP